VEGYISEHSEAGFSHGKCPDAPSELKDKMPEAIIHELQVHQFAQMASLQT
jgi:hypothetical protein